MRNIADAIEQFIISELFANEQDRVDVKRSGKTVLCSQPDHLHPDYPLHPGTGV